MGLVYLCKARIQTLIRGGGVKMSNQNEKDVPGVCPKTGKRLNQKRKKYGLAIWLLPITGLLSLIWFLLRVIPKPSRVAYPCMRVAAPMASTFLVWVFGLAGSIAFIHGTKSFIRKSRYVIAVMCFVAAVGSIFWSFSMTGRMAAADEAVGAGLLWTPSDALNTPMGTATGIYPGRVVWAYDPDATSWDGVTGYWRDTIDQTAVTRMVSRSIQSLSGEDNDTDAWEALFKYFNQKQGKGSVDYVSGEKFAIKLNLNKCDSYSDPGNNTYTAPQVVYAVLRQLVDNVGVAPSDITVYDAARYVPDAIYTPCSSGVLSGVRFVDKSGARTGRTQAQPQRSDPNAAIYHSNPVRTDMVSYEIPTRWMPECVADANYIINLAGLKGHFLPGVTLCAKNHFGSTYVEQDDRYTGWFKYGGFAPGKLIHDYINAYDTTVTESITNFSSPARPMGSYNPLVDLMGSQYLGKKTVLFMIDGIYAARHCTSTLGGQDASDIYVSEGVSYSSPPWGSEPFDGDWSSMILASQDGVAIDSVGLDFLRNEPNVSWVADLTGSSTADDYLHEAAQADNPPSGAYYDPDHDGNVVQLDSLGTHEHWNNATDKQYSRNLGTGDGIELVKLFTHEGDVDTDRDVDAYDLSDVVANWLRKGRIPSGLVGYWKMDHDDGDTTAVDSSGNGNDGTCLGDPDWVDGMIDGAIDLDGTGEYVNLGQPPELDFSSGDFTIAAWFKTAGPDIEIYDSGAGDGAAYIRIHINDANLALEIDDGSDIAKIEDDPNDYLDNRWHHVVFIRDSGTLRAYVDAVPHGTEVDCTSVGSVNSGRDIWIGREDYGRAGSSIKDHDGLIDDVAIFNRALTIEEVQQLHLQTGDINQDRQIDMIDIALLGKDWGKTSRP